MSFENPTPESHSNPGNYQKERTKIGLPPKTAVIAIGVSTGAVFAPGIAGASEASYLPEPATQHMDIPTAEPAQPLTPPEENQESGRHIDAAAQQGFTEVQPGDTLYGLAEAAFGDGAPASTLNDAAANAAQTLGISPDQLAIGTQINNADFFVDPDVFKEGDTLYSKAQNMELADGRTPLEAAEDFAAAHNIDPTNIPVGTIVEAGLPAAETRAEAQEQGSTDGAPVTVASAEPAGDAGDANVQSSVDTADLTLDERIKMGIEDRNSQVSDQGSASPNEDVASGQAVETAPLPSYPPTEFILPGEQHPQPAESNGADAARQLGEPEEPTRDLVEPSEDVMSPAEDVDNNSLSAGDAGVADPASARQVISPENQEEVADEGQDPFPIISYEVLNIEPFDPDVFANGLGPIREAAEQNAGETSPFPANPQDSGRESDAQDQELGAGAIDLPGGAALGHSEAVLEDGQSISISQLESLGFPNDVATLLDVVSANEPSCVALADMWAQEIANERIIFAGSTNNRVEISGHDMLDDCQTFTEDIYNQPQEQIDVATIMLYAVVDYLDEYPERTVTINSITTGIPGTNDGHSHGSLHYTGQALDFGGSREDLQHLFTWLLDAYRPVMPELIYAHPTEGFNIYKSGQGNPDPSHNHVHAAFSIKAPEEAEVEEIEESVEIEYTCSHEHHPNFVYELTTEQESIIDQYDKTEEEKQFARDLLRTLTEEAVRGCYPTNLDITFTQALLETNFGQSSLAREHFNFGGLTAGANFDGETVFSGDLDANGNSIQQQFRSFGSLREGVIGILEFKSEGNKVWYADAIAHRDNPDLHLRGLVAFIDEEGDEVPVSAESPATDDRRLQYAEDPNYIEKVQNWRRVYQTAELFVAGTVDIYSVNG